MGYQMKTVQATLSLLIVLIFAGCSPVKVNIDYDPKAEFSALRTFGIGSATNKNDELVQNPLMLQRVNRAIKTTMEAKGFLHVNDSPDMLLYPHASTKEKISVTDWGNTYSGWWGPGPYGRGYGNRIDVRQYTEGYLIVDVVTPQKKQLVWRGVGSFIVSSKEFTPEESQERADTIIGEILQEFPPQ